MDVERLLAALGIGAEREWSGEYRARCPSPDHEDRNPSWWINGEGLHTCRSCKFGGGPADLVEAVIGFQLRSSAHAWLRERELVDDDPEIEDEPEDDGAPLGPFAMPFGVVGVGDSSSWPTAHRRFAERRGVQPWQVTRWSVAAGVDGRLAGRLVVPVYAEGGRLARYNARALFGQDARYLTPSRSENPDWAVVHGEHLWPANGPRTRLYVTEGVLNAMAVERVMYAFGDVVDDYVASLDGSQLREGYVERLATFRHLVVVSDPDRAGDGVAAQLAVQGCWASFKRSILPPGLDANDLERCDPVALFKVLGGGV